MDPKTQQTLEILADYDTTLRNLLFAYDSPRLSPEMLTTLRGLISHYVAEQAESLLPDEETEIDKAAEQLSDYAEMRQILEDDNLLQCFAFAYAVALTFTSWSQVPWSRIRRMWLDEDTD